jgi:hypothetical protein
MKAPVAGTPFWVYIAAEDAETNDREQENIITYLSHRLIDAETKYSFIEKLCLSFSKLALNYVIIYYLVLA